MDPLAKLVAIEEIKRLKARYFRCVDTKDWVGLATVFTPDAIFDLRAVNSVPNPLTGAVEPPISQSDADVYRGRYAVLAMIHAAVETLVTVHHGHTPEIEITSETTAAGVWAMEDVIRNAPDAPPLSIDGYGHYHETYERLDGVWAIKTTRITRLYVRRG
ncbi:MAG: nuclear transport factor 2 family protein [Caulobacterales bacterium]|nr:nuclear transport factor 2 family protein [Caulobacterales bacterium]